MPRKSLIQSKRVRYKQKPSKYRGNRGSRQQPNDCFVRVFHANGFKMVAMALTPLVSMLGMVHAHMFIIDNMAWFGRPTIVQCHSYFQTSAENSANTHVSVLRFTPLIIDEIT